MLRQKMHSSLTTRWTADEIDTIATFRSIHQIHTSPRTPAPDEHGRNKRRLSPPAPPMKGWGKAVWAATGGFAGKVFNFCWTTTFNGFYAGGGSPYRFDIGTPGVASSAWTEVEPQDDIFHDAYSGHERRGERDLTPIPGALP